MSRARRPLSKSKFRAQTRRLIPGASPALVNRLWAVATMGRAS